MNKGVRAMSIRTSTLGAILADIHHAQRRLDEINRPWAAKRKGR